MPTISAFLPGELFDIIDLGFACAYPATLYARRVTGEHRVRRRRRQHHGLTVEL